MNKNYNNGTQTGTKIEYVRSKDAPIESSKFMGHGICDNVTKSSTLSTATCDVDVIIREVLTISQKLSIPPCDLRGIGIQISKLEKIKKPPGNLTKLFGNMNSMKTIINKNKEQNNINTKTSPQKIEINGMETFNRINDYPNTRRGRGRGRGRSETKNMNLNNFLTIPTTTITAAAITNNNSDNSTSPQCPDISFSDIDLDVFSELPTTIQKEILEQYQNKKSNKTATNISPKFATTTTSNNDKNKTNVSPNITLNTSKDKEKNDHKDKEKNEPKEEDNSMFSGMDTKQIKNIIHDWVTTENAPELCDVKMLGEYFKQLALDKKISQLFMMLKFLYSEILFKEGNCCGWHGSYLKVVDSAQNGMISRYGKPIKVYNEFKCKNKCHLVAGKR